MKYFTITELTKSATAKRNGIDNKPSATVERKLVALIEKVLDPLREAYGAPIIVTSGYRCEKLNRLVGGAASSQHCFDEKTEILTISGWRTYETIEDDDLLLTYNVGKGEIETSPIDEIIIRKHEGKMMHMTSRCVDVMVTDKHRMFVRYANHMYKRKGCHNISPKGQAYFDSLKTDNDLYHFEIAEDVFGKRRMYKCAGLYEGGNEADLSLLDFVMAFVCDGYWCHKKKNLSMGFRFKKMRKITHLQELATSLGWDCAVHLDKHGITNFHFRNEYARLVYDIVGDGKVLPKWLVTLSAKDKMRLVECYNSFDGHTDNRDSKGRMNITTTIKENADVLQAMIVTSGMKCDMISCEEHPYIINGDIGRGKPYYILYTCPKTESKVSESGYEWVDYNGIVWCVNNRNTTLITRRNGKVSIQGNCKGEAVDIRTVSDKPEDNKKLYDLIVKLKLPFDQLINEYGYDWVHVSFGSRHRRQKLRAVKRNGRTIYLNA